MIFCKLLLLQFDLTIYDIIIKKILFLIHNKTKIILAFLNKNDHNIIIFDYL